MPHKAWPPAHTRMMVAYIAWLNSWSTPDPTYDADSFRGAYGWVEHLVTYTTDYEVVVLRASDGDEGGPATLTGYFSDLTMDWMTVEFDTQLSIAYGQGQLLFHGRPSPTG